MTTPQFEDNPQYEELIEVYRITEWKDGAVFKTEFVKESWVPMGARGDVNANEIYVPLSTSDNRLFTETMRRVYPVNLKKATCPAEHNPGVWPYVSRCVASAQVDHTVHEDREGRTW